VVGWLREPFSFREWLLVVDSSLATCLITPVQFIIINNSVALYFPNIPAVTTDNLYFFYFFCLFTACFDPYGPSSGEILKE
jgi:hypothetical protein